MKAEIYTSDGKLIRVIDCTAIIPADITSSVTVVMNDQKTVASVPDNCIVIKIEE